ncbi:MAG: AsmA family protein [Planctomycetota bacterium]
MVVGCLFRKLYFVFGGLVVLAVLVLVGGHLLLGRLVAAGIRTAGPLVLRVPVGVDDVDVSLLGGSFALQGLTLGNPEGFDSPRSAELGRAEVELRWRSLISDTVVIPRIDVRGPELTLEYSEGRTNLGAILERVPDPGRRETEKKFLLDAVRIRESVVRVAGLPAGQALQLRLPDIELEDLSEGEPRTPEELAVLILKAIQREVLREARGELSGSQLDQLENEVLEKGRDILQKGSEKLKQKLEDLLE